MKNDQPELLQKYMMLSIHKVGCLSMCRQERAGGCSPGGVAVPISARSASLTRGCSCGVSRK
jgi:hypothetical protein